MPTKKPEANTTSENGGGYLLSPDVTDPTREVYLVDPANGRVLETHAGGLEIATIETSDGVSRLLAADGKQLEQYPGKHAGFSWVEGRGVYGRCDVEGPLVAFKTRPQDKGFTYSLKRLP
jgi:hypothetical protein